MRTLIRHFQGVVHGITPSNGNRRFLKNAHHAWARWQAEKGGNYHYSSGAAMPLPASGEANNSTGALIVRLHSVGINGNDHEAAFRSVVAGDVLTIGTSTGVIMGPAFFNGKVAQFSMQSWVSPPNGDYLITITRP